MRCMSKPRLEDDDFLLDFDGVAVCEEDEGLWSANVVVMFETEGEANDWAGRFAAHGFLLVLEDMDGTVH